MHKISTFSAADTYAPCFMADYNTRFGKPARNDIDAHRSLRDEENPVQALTWPERRKIAKALTIQYAASCICWRTSWRIAG
ncbi:hypothetical protein [Caballeronia sp. LZ035]|uniref:hypothetical protein n=1 Tax=Caballeronia sp. LZ035 TaxID=3038568 RepID=UPI002863D3C7|nr:hypothetical protein [Caballeronia sp. LZ035]MDR5757118.1 hypothetical protein [Caballeronia sp. LZ035]